MVELVDAPDSKSGGSNPMGVRFPPSAPLILVKRNIARFPEDFMFQLNKEEASELSRSQIVTLKRGQNIKYLQHAFTEHGAIMAATILNSPGAIEMSIFVVRAFVKLREKLIQHKDLKHKIEEMEKKYNSQFKIVFNAAYFGLTGRLFRF